jgi:predicted acylesterase/phospholipase RssA
VIGGRRVALCLPGGGLTGALYQVGALAAVEDAALAPEYALYVGSSSGATVAAALAGGIGVTRIYRALVDPADNFFPLERRHLLHLDLDEWRRALVTGGVALRHALARITTRRGPGEPAPAFVLEQLDRLNDSLPAGLFKLDRYERLLAQFFLRRGVPNAFFAMPKPLRVATHELDTGARTVFGSEGNEAAPVSLACAASLALPMFFSPVRIGDRHYLEGGLGAVAHLDVAERAGADVALVVNPLVPLAAPDAGAIPTGHGLGQSVRDKGLLWVSNQAMRIGAHARLVEEIERTRSHGKMRVVVLEPAPADVLLFLHNPVNFDARRAILEHAYRTTRARLSRADALEAELAPS